MPQQFSSTPENRTVPRTLFVPVRRRKPTSLSSLHSTVSKSSQDTTNDIYSSPATPVARQVLSEADDPGNWGIRLVDNTSSDQPGWARRVTVSHPEVIRGAGYLSEKNGYVVWKCCITMLEGHTIVCYKRYSDFANLRKSIICAFPHLGPTIPRLPAKSIVSRFRPAFLEKRAHGLEYFLAYVVLHPEIGNSNVLKEFLI